MQAVQQLIEQQVLRAAQEMENQIDSELKKLENLEDDDIENLRQRRIQELKKLQLKRAEWARKGHGEYNEVEEKEFFKEIKGEERMVCHFYRSSLPCQIIDKHLAMLAARHLETKFVRVHAEKAPFLTERLKIWMLPTVAVIKNEKTTDYIVGLDELGGVEDFSTETISARLAAAGAIFEDAMPAARPAADEAQARTLRQGGHSGAPIEAAATPPSSWYHSPDILRLEERSVFARSWLAVAHESALAAPGTYAAGELAGLQWVAVRDQGGVLRAFHNVCRHHAAILAPPGDGTLGDGCLRCPYHGWQYGLDGRLLKATRLKGIEGFRAADHGLAPLAAQAWGGFVWVRAAAAGGSSSDSLDSRSSSGGEQRQAAHQSVQHDRQQQQQQDVAAWLGPRGAAAALAAGIADALVHVASREYEIACNWKVFADNYLDGGYHVSVAHAELASGLDLGSYSSATYERLSIQSCMPAGGGEGAAAAAAGAAAAGGGEAAAGATARRRLAGGRPPAYIFVYPNLMLNRYGPWLDVNTVVPLGPERCKVLFDYYLEPALADDAAYIDASLAASDSVQQEDVALCEAVQRGLRSPAYDTGRWAL
ncbi:choline isoform B [Micractinium conductrix]|uniref:Choline monooxygenase, chloroplastic n=1 Tax=Micractinium conductrix TaxID=554055 RepID=A0A2P6VH59_9CHLO|nr:choline isoform B [Micractinium conductrix]|eukprot:PSC73423.1 choline isoform B [Micractinium conductrix]